MAPPFIQQQAVRIFRQCLEVHWMINFGKYFDEQLGIMFMSEIGVI